MLRLIAHARKLAVASALAIASLGIVIPIPASAAAAPGHWDITVGGGDFRQLSSLNRFYPNNITVHPGDEVSFNWMGFHTVTFNPPPHSTVFDAFGGPPGSSTLDSPTTFVNAVPAFNPNGPPPSFVLTIAGNLPDGKYAFQCLLHQFMKGAIEVTRGELPATNADNQTLGNAQAAADLARLISLDARTTREAADESGEATVGVSNKAGDFVKFYPSAITVRAGDELTFTTRDLQDPHTVTFGPVPGNPQDPTTGVFPSGPGNPNAFDGTSALNSGFLFHESQYDYWNLKDSPVAAALPRTEWSVTFTTPGTYNFYCDLHGQLLPDGSVVGMSGTITVLPAENDN
jgi:plastocyanin